MVRLRIDELLKEAGRTVYWLGKQPGLTDMTVYRLRHGKTGAIKFETIEALCKALQCQPGDLFDRLGHAPKPKARLKRKPKPP
jgi:putative transcriptional regulator